MESEEQRVCANCKREIPAVNFTIHTVHCARNIKMCPVCKEPVLQAGLEEHHAKLHKLLPCKQCGEKVCGTDLEDHIRDSCGHTIKSCRFCELELPRRELPTHEGYCGVRTEQCPDCREWVMIKYRQLHLDSNHGFLRLDDDPVHQPKKELSKATNLPKTTNIPKQTNILKPKNTNLMSARTEMRYYNPIQNGPSTSQDMSSRIQNSGQNYEVPMPSVSRSSNGATNVYQDASPSVSRYQNGVQNVFNDNLPSASRSNQNGGAKIPLKRTNDQPQINTTVTAANKVEKNLPISRGAVKKRTAPQPPAPAPPCPAPADPRRDLAYYSALQRQQREERARQQQTAYNLAHGLPPVLSAAAKLEKLRQMDLLHGRELPEPDYRGRLRGQVWMGSHVPLGQTVGSGSSQEEDPGTGHLEVERRNSPRDRSPRDRSPRDPTEDSRQVEDEDDGRNEFIDVVVKPMTPAQFMARFQELQMQTEGGERGERGGDRFSEIKSSLRELRRGLNEVTAPYNSNNANVVNNSGAVRRRSPRVSPVPPRAPPFAPPDEGEVELPCEFCGVPVPASDLVQHQTGCRPDLAQFRPPRRAPTPPPAAPPEPVIPCEFCAEPLPVYLLSEHQERCGREANLLYPD